MNNENNAPAAAPAALQAFTSCPEWGIGGQFVYDPATGQRTRVDAVPAPGAEATGSVPADQPAAQVKKERARA